MLLLRTTLNKPFLNPLTRIAVLPVLRPDPPAPPVVRERVSHGQHWVKKAAPLCIGVSATRVCDTSAKVYAAKPESDMSAKKVCRHARNMWQRFTKKEKTLPIFVLRFPGKVAARNFTKDPRQIPGAMKQNSFTERLWELGSTKKYQLRIIFWHRVNGFGRGGGLATCALAIFSAFSLPAARRSPRRKSTSLSVVYPHLVVNAALLIESKFRNGRAA